MPKNGEVRFQKRSFAAQTTTSKHALRYRVAEAKLGKQQFGFGIAPFFDAGTVRNHWQDLNFKDIKYAYGVGLRVAWNQSTIIFLDYGVSKEDKLLYFGIG
ncbi:MAG: BamA/TamA family outer membrane protein, partial [Phaeodactylibacter sp.]|nr:BamA/TamA family outer membrane protein [Phaeodactylibacter sp.]